MKGRRIALVLLASLEVALSLLWGSGWLVRAKPATRLNNQFTVDTADPFAAGKALGSTYEEEINDIISRCGYLPPFQRSLGDNNSVHALIAAKKGDCEADAIAVGQLDEWNNLVQQLPISFISSPPLGPHYLLAETKLSFAGLADSIVKCLDGKPNSLLQQFLCPTRSLDFECRCCFVNGGRASEAIVRSLQDDSVDIYRGKDLAAIVSEAKQVKKLTPELKIQVARQAIKNAKLNIFYSSYLSKEYFDEILVQIADIKAENADIKAENADIKAQHADIKAQHADIKAQIADIEAELELIKNMILLKNNNNTMEWVELIPYTS